MSHSTSTFIRFGLAVALGLAVTLAAGHAAETDVVGTFSVKCVFRTKSLLAKGDDSTFGLTDFFIFGEDRSLTMYAVIPGAGTWSYTPGNDSWSGDMSAAATTFFEGMTLGTVKMKRAGLKNAHLYGAFLAGDLDAKWKALVGGKNLKSRLTGVFVGSPS